jgi:hypothetical protein
VVGGLSRVTSLSRSVNQGQASATFAWGDTPDSDLVVSFSNGTFRQYGHEVAQGSTKEGLNPPGATDNRVVASYNLNATSNPARKAYDPASKYIILSCDQESPFTGVSASPTAPPERCVGYEYDTGTTTNRKS